MGPGNQTRVVRLGCKHCYLLRYRSALTLLFKSDPPIETPASQLAFLPGDAEAGSGTQRRLLFRELPEVKGKWNSSRELLVPCFIGGVGGTLSYVG